MKDPITTENVNEMIVEGILEISINRPTFQVELRLAAYQDLKVGSPAAPEAASEAPQ